MTDQPVPPGGPGSPWGDGYRPPPPAQTPASTPAPPPYPAPGAGYPPPAPPAAGGRFLPPGGAAMHPAAGWPQQGYPPTPKRPKKSILPVVLVVVVLAALVGVGIAAHPWRKAASDAAGVANTAPGGGDPEAPTLGPVGSTGVPGSEPSPNVSHNIRDLSEADLTEVLPQTDELIRRLVKEGGPPLAWRLASQATQTTNGPAQPSDCATGSPPVADWTSVQYGLLDANGGIHGQASIHLQKMASNRAADAFVHARSSQEYAACVGEKHADDLRTETGGIVGKATVVSLGLNAYSVTWLYSTPYTINGSPCVDYDDLWIKAIERYVLVVDLDTCGDHFNQLGESNFVAVTGGNVEFPDRKHD